MGQQQTSPGMSPGYVVAMCAAITVGAFVQLTYFFTIPLAAGLVVAVTSR